MSNRKIALRPDNPYSTGSIESFEDNQPILVREKILYKPAEDDDFHLVIQGEDLTTISFKWYESSKYYWVLADVNNIENPLDLTGITGLVIPSLDRTKTLSKRI
tara:strand:+ start:145 stop:456 length:312 start_codon:yes stop_codon:yes gene_type:complete